MPERISQGSTLRVPLQAYLASDHISPATGKTIAIQISKNGAAYGNPNAGATNATGIGNGSYYVDLDATDLGTIGPLFVRGTEGTIDPVVAIYNVIEPAVIYRGSVTSGASTTGFTDSAAPTRPDQNWRSRIIIFETGTITGCATDIKSYVDSTKAFTFSATPAGLTTGDKYRIV